MLGWMRSEPGTGGGIRHVVVMGVSGCGKSTVGRALAKRLGWQWIEGDQLHPDSNIRKMAAGQPLEDSDRLPWLRRVAAEIGGLQARGIASVTGCSALRRAYRDILRDAAPGVGFLHLHGSRELLAARTGNRPGHFFPAALLESQLATQEPLTPDADGLRVDLSLPLADQVDRAIAGLNLRPRPLSPSGT